MVFLEGEVLQERLNGRIPLSGSIKIQYETSNYDRYSEDFVINGVVNTGGSCICYSAEKKLPNGTSCCGILKEFYPMDIDDGSADKGAYAFHLKRHVKDDTAVSNQLYSAESTRSRFEDAKKEFIESHNKVLELIKKDKKGDSYFQYFEIYHGISKFGDNNRTVYIWTPGDRSLTSFEDHLNDMQQRVAAETESPSGNLSLYLAKELRFILQSVKALAKGIHIIHENNMLHLDIKPSNFGVRDLGERNGDNLSVAMFDVNSLHSRDSARDIRTQGTAYFAAPELAGKLKTMKVGCKADIYSLGATLYNAIVVINGKTRGLYETENFSEITSKLRHSLLFENSDYTSGVEIMDGLINILKCSLARNPDDDMRGLTEFESIEEFIAAIDEVDGKLKGIIEIGIKEETTGQKVILKMADKEEYYGKEIQKIGGAVSAMQCLLYDRPLYDYVQDGKLNVLVLGAGVFGQKFLDIALEMSQIKGCYLNVIVASKDKERDERRYLESRPEFKNYFWVNGEAPAYLGKYSKSVRCDYGRVTFVKIKSDLAIGSDNASILEETLASDEKFGYVFVSLSDEGLNKKVAKDLTKTSLLKNDNAIVNFVTYKKLKKEDGKKQKASDSVINPVYITDALIARHRDCNFLHNAGFNCHIMWNNSLSLDMSNVCKEFLQPYNYLASMSMAISLKYKLHSIGLSLEDVRNENKIADRREKMFALSRDYREKIGIGVKERTKEQLKCLNELTMYEHARWNTNMICSSHKVLVMDEIKELDLNSGNKDRAQRKHSCIVPSSSAWMLGSDEWSKTLSRWDEGDLTNRQIYTSLDPLDQMSVNLHRYYKNKAEAFSDLALEAEAEIARRYIGSNYELMVAFNAYMTALHAVKTRETRKSNVMKNFSHCDTVLSKKLAATNPSNKKDIEDKIKKIKKLYEPVIEAYKYIDYKEMDHRILVSLPFILNYTPQQRICMPFVVDEAENKWFDNVASSLVINPATVTYMTRADNPSGVVKSSMLRVVSYVAKLMDNHNLQTKMNFVFYVDTSDRALSNDASAKAKAALKAVSPRVDSVDFIELNEYSELTQKIKNIFKINYESPMRFSAVELRSDEISGAISSILNEIALPAYRFDSVAMRFKAVNTNGYCWYNDIPFDVHLNIEDAFVAHDRLGVYSDPELQKDYFDIWKRCCGDFYKMEGWKALCKAIGEKIKTDDKLLALNIKENKASAGSTVVTAHFLPCFCRASIQKILAFLADESVGMVESWSIEDHNSAMFRVEFKSNAKVKTEFTRLLSKNLYALADESKIQTYCVKNFIRITGNSLVINAFDFDKCMWESIGTTADKATDRQKDLYNYARKHFKYLIEKGYIVDMSVDAFRDIGDTVSLREKSFKFCFASESIKALVSSEGQLAELYAYYKIKESGLYDDVCVSIEVQRHESDEDDDDYVSTQEFDIVAVKGFSTQLIEVKCCNRLETDFYTKLSAIGSRFGINKKLALLSLSADRFHVSNNEDVIKNGEMEEGIKTIVCQGDQIAESLFGLMKETE